MMVSTDINFQHNKDLVVTGLICLKGKENDENRYFMVEDFTPIKYDYYNNFSVLLDELNYSHSDISKLVSSKMRSIIEECRIESKNNIGRIVTKKYTPIEIYEDCIFDQIDDLIDGMRFGVIMLDNGKTRPYDYLDYYQKVGLRSTIITPIINAIFDTDILNTFKNFFTNRALNIKKSGDDVKNALLTNYTKDLKRDKNGNFIIGSGKKVSDKVKMAAYHYILINNNMPFSSALFLDVMERAYRGYLDIDLIEEIYYTNKVKEIEFIMSDIGFMDSVQTEEVEDVLGKVREKLDFYREKNKNRFRIYLDGLVKNKELDVNNPYHMAVGNLYMRYCQDPEIVNDYPEEIIGRDIRTVIEKDSYEYRPIQKKFISSRTIGQKNK